VDENPLNLSPRGHAEHRPCRAIGQLDVKLPVEEVLEQRWAAWTICPLPKVGVFFARVEIGKGRSGRVVFV